MLNAENSTSAEKMKSTRGPAVWLLLFGALMLAITLPLRIWQQMYIVEAGTGFWAVQGHVTVILLYIALGVLAALPFAGGIALRNQLTLDLRRDFRPAEGIAALLAALAVAAGAATALHFAFLIFTGRLVPDDIRPQVDQMMQYYIRTGAMAALLEALFGAGAALFFANLALADFRPAKTQVRRLLALMPVLWTVSRILRRFSRTISFLRVSDLFLTLAALVLLMIFFLAFAQLLGGINDAGKEWRLAAAGIPAAVLLVLCYLPRLIAYVFMNGVPSRDAVMELADPAIALFICVFLYGRLLYGTKQAAVAVEPAGG